MAMNDRDRARLTIPDVVSFSLHVGHPAHNAGSVIPKGQAGPIITNVTESSTLLQEPGLVRVLWHLEPRNVLHCIGDVPHHI